MYDYGYDDDLKNCPAASCHTLLRRSSGNGISLDVQGELITKTKVTVDQSLCVGCGACVDICPVSAVSINDGKVSVDQDICVECCSCAATCMENAIFCPAFEERVRLNDSPKMVHRSTKDNCDDDYDNDYDVIPIENITQEIREIEREQAKRDAESAKLFGMTYEEYKRKSDETMRRYDFQAMVGGIIFTCLLAWVLVFY